MCYVSLCRLSLNLRGGNTLEKRTLLELYGAHMTDLFALIYYNSEIYLCTKISFVCKNENTFVSKRDSYVKCSIESFEMFV